MWINRDFFSLIWSTSFLHGISFFIISSILWYLCTIFLVLVPLSPLKSELINVKSRTYPNRTIIFSSQLSVDVKIHETNLRRLMVSLCGHLLCILLLVNLKLLINMIKQCIMYARECSTAFSTSSRVDFHLDDYSHSNFLYLLTDCFLQTTLFIITNWKRINVMMWVFTFITCTACSILWGFPFTGWTPTNCSINFISRVNDPSLKPQSCPHLSFGHPLSFHELEM